MKSLSVAAVIVSERTSPLFPSGLRGLSLTFKLRPAALPIDIWKEFSAVNLRVIPGSRSSPELAVWPSELTLTHVCSCASMFKVSACVAAAGGGGGGSGSSEAGAGVLAASVVTGAVDGG